MLARKLTTYLTLAMLLLVSMVGAIHANDLNYAPALCDLGAPGQLSPGMTTRTSLKVEPDAVVAQFGQANALMDAMIDAQINDGLLGLPHAIHQDAALQPIMVPNVAGNTAIEVTGNATCVSYFDGNMIVRYIPVLVDGANGYMIETVLWLSAAVQTDGDGDNPINFQVENFSLRLLTPVYTPVVPSGGNGEVLAPDAIQGADYCDGAPTSYLQVGMQAEMFITGFMQNYTYENDYPSGLGEPFNLNAYGLQISELVDDGGLLSNPNVDLYFMDDYMLVSSDSVKQAAGLFPPVVDIIEGPECGAWNLNNAGGEQFNFPEVHLTYWKIRVELNGDLVEGWFPENAFSDIWWDDNPNFWNAGITTYHLHPLSDSAANSNSCPAPQQQSGSRVEPSRGTLNIRVEPDGDVIGRLETREHILLLGQPVCDGGSNWWQTERGFIAENDPTTGTQLITPYIPDPTPMPQDPRPEDTGSSNSGGGESNPAPRQPETQPTPDPTRPPRATPEPTRPPRAGTCDPATGRGC